MTEFLDGVRARKAFHPTKQVQVLHAYGYVFDGFNEPSDWQFDEASYVTVPSYHLSDLESIIRYCHTEVKDNKAVWDAKHEPGQSNMRIPPRLVIDSKLIYLFSDVEETIETHHLNQAARKTNQLKKLQAAHNAMVESENKANVVCMVLLIVLCVVLYVLVTSVE
tara:strand:- start:625 stop:1119 length:495 start_codon:yes stop_codon:yes gene_type:complete